MFANTRINFHPALRRAGGGGLTPGANTHTENTNTEVLTRQRPGTPSPLTQYLSVTGIRERSGSAGVAAENNYLGVAVGGHLQRLFPRPDSCCHRKEAEEDAKHAAAAKASERASCHLSGFLFSRFSETLSRSYLQIACKVLRSALSPPLRAPLPPRN